MQHPAKDQGLDGSHLGQSRTLLIPGKSEVVGRSKVWPGSSPQVGVRTRAGKVGGQGLTHLQQCPAWSRRQVTLQHKGVPKALELSYCDIFYHSTTWKSWLQLNLLASSVLWTWRKHGSRKTHGHAEEHSSFISMTQQCNSKMQRENEE